MKALFKLLVTLIGVILILCIIVVIVLSTMDANEYKAWISTKFHEQTGRTLTLDGDIKLTIYPWLGLQANGVTISNAIGFGDQPFFHVIRLNTRIKLIPLLSNQYEVDTVKFYGAWINLLRNS